MNLRQASLVSGIGYLLIFISGFYANFAILETMVVPSNAEVTVTNFLKDRSSLGWGIVGFLAMLFFDVVLVYSLFFVTKKVSRKLSFVASGFRLLHAIGFGIALMCLVEIYRITGDSLGLNMSSLQNLVMFLLQRFDEIWTMGLLLFGVHLTLLGYLSLKSDFVPKGLGCMLLLAAIGYLVSCSAKLVMPNYDDYEQGLELLVVLFGVAGELSFTVWLLIKGLKKAQ
nr:DUF4386 domain-containing protein [uncultured Allomuricauda sp.]